MTHRRHPFEQDAYDNGRDEVNEGRKFDNRGDDHASKWSQEQGNASSWIEIDSVGECGENKYSWHRGASWKDRTDGWNKSEKRDNWGDRNSYWGDKSDKYEDRNVKEDWNTKSKDWSEKKEGWNTRRRDDPWEDKERETRSADSVDEGRDDSSWRVKDDSNWRGRDQRDRDRSREERDRSRERRDRSRERRDRDRSRDRDRRHRRSYSNSPDRDSQQNLGGDWICKCGAFNFKRRVSCFRTRCGASRGEAVSIVAIDKTMKTIQQNTDFALKISSQQFIAAEIPTLAAYSAQIYAENKAEHATYLKYYTDYYTQMLAQKNENVDNKTDSAKVNVGAAVAQSAISQLHGKTAVIKRLPTGTDNKTYPVPDVSKYLYDQTSGYYYDSNTGLYYDANTQYYFNNQINQYLYWDTSRHTYILASTLQNYNKNNSAPQTADKSAPATEKQTNEDEKKPKSENKVDKVKVAKKIAKDMERWAKAMNQRKDAAKVGIEPQINASASSSKSADIGFSVLEQRVPVNNNDVQINNQTPLLVPSYGAGSDSSGDESDMFVDWEKLACLLCKRQFPSKDVLEKHQLMSELHKQNLEALKSKRDDGRGSSSNSKEQSVYRDRAAERRMQYGEDDTPIVRSVRPDPIVPSVPQEIGEENIGNRLLKKMGWTAGKGLGKEGQGILGPVEATTTGLGRKKGIYTAGPGETYRGCVKKLTMARYQDLVGSEGNT